MNEPNQKRRELSIHFTPIYNILIQSQHLKLSRIERSLVILFASYQSNGCNWSRESLKKYCECGPYHLERAIRRLKFMKIIDVARGGWRQRKPARRESNRYLFEPNPYNWRVTKETQEMIVRQALSMKMEPQEFICEAFPNQLGLEIAFEKCVPTYAKGRKGRSKKQKQPAVATGTTQVESQPIQSGVDEWREKLLTIRADEFPYASLAVLYFQHQHEIDLVRNTIDHGFPAEEREYYENLHYTYVDRTRKRTPEEASIFNKITDWKSIGTPDKVIVSLLKSKTENKNSPQESGM